jgi:hypothetical protein
MEQRILSIIIVVLALIASPAVAGSFEVPLSALFQYSPVQLGRSVNTVRSNTYFAPRLIFKKEIALSQLGEATVGERCAIVATKAETSRGYFNAYLNVAPGGKILENSSYEMRLISYSQDLLKISLVGAKESIHALELTCTHPSIQSWTVSEFESKLGFQARVYASAKIADMKKFAHAVGKTSDSLDSLKGSMFNGLFGSGLPGTMGIQLLLGANLKAYAETSNANLMVGKRCKLISQKNAAMSDQYLKGSKFAFREYRSVNKGKTELVFDNWNQSPHQVRVECRGDLENVKQMTVAEVEHDLNGTIQFYRK